MQKKYLETIKTKTLELERIINQLFMFSKIDLGEFPFVLEKIDVDEQLHRLIDSVQEEYKKNGLIISLNEGANSAYVNADLQQLRNVVMNVIENSLKYKTAENGQLHIMTYTIDPDVIIELKDNGPGVGSEEVDKLFNVFYRADPARSGNKSGSGLGLAISSRVLARMGGSIRAENCEEGGLAIFITLPIYSGGHTNEKDINR
jgi:signal transduction histidine kinase